MTAHPPDLPPPLEGEDAKAYQRRITLAMGSPVHPHAIDPDKTKITSPLARAVALAVAIAGGGYYAGIKIQTQTYEILGLKSQVGDLPKKSDLENLRRELTDATAHRLEHAQVRCPRVVTRGESWIDCKLILQP